jgi:hypothetical protein
VACCPTLSRAPREGLRQLAAAAADLLAALGLATAPDVDDADDAHRVRVRETGARILVEDAEMFEGLKRADAVGGADAQTRRRVLDELEGSGQAASVSFG